MSKSHFLCLFGVDCDMDLARFWIDHYRAFHFDTYTIWLHSARGDRMLVNQALRLFCINGFNAMSVDGRFGDGRLRDRLCNEFRRTVHPDDFIVTADSDEFHDLTPQGYREALSRYDVITGNLIDAYDDILHSAAPGRPLKAQFPLLGIVEDQVMRSAPEGLRPMWPLTIRSKVLAARADLPVFYVGSHFLSHYPRDMVFSQPYPVLHYSWRNTVLDRMAGKTYYRSIHIWYTQLFFGIETITPGLERKEVEEMQTQIDKGWIPCRK